jgi:lysophospholipase L1-like esterase
LTKGFNDAYPLVNRYREAVLPSAQQLRQASGGASCLIMAPLDRSERNGLGLVEGNRLIPRIIASQREIAGELGCAFFDTYAGMGGEGSIGTWASSGLAGGDLVHPTPEGAELIGRGLFDALERAFGLYNSRSR